MPHSKVRSQRPGISDSWTGEVVQGCSGGTALIRNAEVHARTEQDPWLFGNKNGTVPLMTPVEKAVKCERGIWWCRWLCAVPVRILWTGLAAADDESILSCFASGCFDIPQVRHPTTYAWLIGRRPQFLSLSTHLVACLACFASLV